MKYFICIIIGFLMLWSADEIYAQTPAKKSKHVSISAGATERVIEYDLPGSFDISKLVSSFKKETSESYDSVRTRGRINTVDGYYNIKLLLNNDIPLIDLKRNHPVSGNPDNGVQRNKYTYIRGSMGGIKGYAYGYELMGMASALPISKILTSECAGENVNYASTDTWWKFWTSEELSATYATLLQQAMGAYNHTQAYKFLGTPSAEEENCIAEFLHSSTIYNLKVEIRIKNATLNYIEMLDVFADGVDPFKELEKHSDQVVVKSNGTVIGEFLFGDTPTPPLNVTLGDKLTFEVSSQEHIKPEIRGVPGVWIARFAGELMYYCSPSVTPGEFNPWIGFDSRIHNLMVRKFPVGFEEKVPDWSYNEHTKKYTWTWTAQRRMDATKTKYTPSHIWPKYHLVNGVKQRRNQKEGVNMQYLNYWKNWPTLNSSSFKNYDGAVKYMMGVDDDELVYFNSKYHDANQPGHAPTPPGGIAKLETLPWKSMPEGEEVTYHSDTGYPRRGSALNEMIFAYRRNREAIKNPTSGYDDHNERYNGYEIQDIGTSETHPNGTGSGNNKQPGTVSIRIGSKEIKLKFNVSAPLNTDAGFYGSLTGVNSPAYGEESAQYKLKGLKNLSHTELDKFSMEYEWMDRLGNLTKQTVYLKDASATDKTIISQNGEWSAHFNLDKPAYSSITAYYQRTPTSQRVMIAGKELKAIFLLMLGVANDATGLILNQGDGHGAKIFQEEYRNTSGGRFTEARKFGAKIRYTDKYVRRYIVQKGTKITFTADDGDPHLFDNTNTEYYLGSRTMAKRVKDSYLDGSDPDVSVPYLKYYVNDVEVTGGNRTAKKMTYTFNNTGSYDVKASYRNTSNLHTQVVVVDYASDKKGEYKIGSLPKEYITWLGLTTEEAKGLRFASVSNLLSKFSYVDGYRAFNGKSVEGKKNRWANFNDYAQNYKWERVRKGNTGYGYKEDKKTDVKTLANTHAKVQFYLNKYDEKVRKAWFWKDWALHYSSNWLRPLQNGLQGLPPYVNRSQVDLIYDKGVKLSKYNSYISNKLFTPTPVAEWQYVVPLVSITNYQGVRVRTNPSCIYDLNKLFDNTVGAFSGVPNLPVDVNSIQAPDYADDYKNQQDFYHALKGNRIVIFSSSDLADGDVIKLYNVDPRNNSNTKLITSSSWNEKTTPTPARRFPDEQISIKEHIEMVEEVAETIVYPNPNIRLFKVRVSDKVGDIINLNISDLSGNTVYYNKSVNEVGLRSVEVNTSSLPKGLYILSIQGKNAMEAHKIIIK